MVNTESIIATHRFGLGPRPEELEATGNNPRNWLLQQIISPSSAPRLSSSAEIYSLQLAVQRERMTASENEPRVANQQLGAAQLRDIVARTRFGMETEKPFLERIVRFWNNHFAISTNKVSTSGMGGPFEAEAIRPNVLGSFHELLEASTKHPAMLNYLDNSRSTGPNSQLGSRRDSGLNENLAREILELHTLGVDGGYTQAGVTNFAKIITGWTVPNAQVANRLSVEPGKFAFIGAQHEPGTHKLLGKDYRENGVAQGEAVLKDLSKHPSTARHISTKLAKHFISDEPSEESVAALESSFLQSNGDLPSLYKTLIDLPEAWKPETTKFRTPYEWLTAIFRATQMSVNDRELQVSISSFGQVPWRPGSPAGWPDHAGAWDSPDALGKRIEWANSFAQRATNVSSKDVANTLFGSQLTTSYQTTYDAIRRAESNQQALVMLLMAPPVLRR